MTPADAAKLLTLTTRTRELQKAYFRTRSPAALAESRDAERRLDEFLRAVTTKPAADLFAEGGAA